jgi:hypothetical protein
MKTFRSVVYSLFIFITIVLLINSNFIGNFYWQQLSLFGDHETLVNWLECNSIGVDLYTTEQLVCNNKNISIFNYGHILLVLPWNETLDSFYRTYLPYITIFLFIFLTIKIINPKKKIELVLLFLCLFNPSTLLGFDRLNIDLIIYLFTIIICFNRIYFLNWFFTWCLTLTKVFPAVLFINIFFENPKRSLKNILIIIIFIVLITFVYFFFFKDFILFFLDNISAGRAGYHYLFSLNSLPKIFKYIFNSDYQLLLIIFYSLFIYLVIKSYKKYSSEIKESDIDTFSVDSKLFMVGGYLTVINFLIFSNWFYREIFIILMIPYILHNKISTTFNFNYLFINILIARYIFLFVYGYTNIHDDISYVNSVRVFSNKFLIIIFIKSVFDFFIMCIFSSILFQKSKLYFKRLINS